MGNINTTSAGHIYQRPVYWRRISATRRAIYSYFTYWDTARPASADCAERLSSLDVSTHQPERQSLKASDLFVNTSLVHLLEKCFNTPGVHLVEVPVDYSDNDRILNHEIKEKSRSI